jgi:uncharacterized phiE125 gp8 family phage protein
MFAPVLVTGPVDAVVDLALLKAQVRVLHDFEDDLMQIYLDAAIRHLDGPTGILGRCLVTQTWRQDQDGWHAEYRLPVPDITEAVVTYTDPEGVTQSVAPSAYTVENRPEAAFLRFLPGFERPALSDRAGPVQIAVTAGFGAPDAVPRPIVAAILILAAHWHAHRLPVVAGQALAEVPMSFDALIAPWRRGMV